MKKILYLLLAILLNSCSEVVVNHDLATIKLQTNDTLHASFEELFKITEYISLKENENYHMKSIRKIEYYNGEYYVHCSYDKTGLIVYDKEGRFLRKIGAYGKGHGEYQKTCDFTIDRKNNRILLLCWSSVLKIYNLNGDFIEEKKLTNSALWSIACIDGNILCTTDHKTYTEGDDAFLFYLFNQKLELISKHTNVLPESMGMFSFAASKLKIYKNKFTYFDFYTHQIYTLDKLGNILQCYKYDRDNLMPTKNFKDDIRFVEGQNSHSFILDNIFINDRIVTIYNESPQLRYLISDLSGNSIENRKMRGVLPRLYYYDDETIISVATVDDMPSIIGKGVEPEDSINGNLFYLIKYKLRKK